MALAVESPKRVSFAKLTDVLPMPNLIEMQLSSFQWFQTEGLQELFDEIRPIQDFSGKMELEFSVPAEPFGEPKYTEAQCRERDMTYAAPLNVRAKLLIKETGEIIEKTIFMGDFPLMTDAGHLHHQRRRARRGQPARALARRLLHARRSIPATGRTLYMAKLIPNRGAWLEFETSNKDVLTVKVDRKRKIPVTTLLRAIGYEHRRARSQSAASPTSTPTPTTTTSRATLDKDTTKNAEAGLHRDVQEAAPGDPPTLENAASLMQSLFFNPRRYDLGRVGRYKLNKRLGLDRPINERTLTTEDLVAIVQQLIELNNSVDSDAGPIRRTTSTTWATAACARWAS